jgi:hypothetical protein
MAGGDQAAEDFAACPEEDIAAVKNIVQLRRSVSQPRDVSMASLGKYQSLMFGQEDDDEEAAADPIGIMGRAPKANECRRKWSKEEEDEIKSMVDLKNMKEQPKAILSKNMLKKSKEQDGAIQHRSESALKNKLIRTWVAYHKGESANK